MPTVKELGAIASLNIPEGWVVYPAEELPGRRHLQKFGPYDRADVSLLSCVRGVELSSPGRDAFMRTLYSNFHALNQAEVSDLSEVLEGAANPDAFLIEEAHTTYLNSRRVIRVTGTWTKFKLKETTCYVDLNGDSHHVQQLSLGTQIKDFAHFADLCEREILLSIEWSKH